VSRQAGPRLEVGADRGVGTRQRDQVTWLATAQCIDEPQQQAGGERSARRLDLECRG